MQRPDIAEKPLVLTGTLTANQRAAFASDVTDSVDSSGSDSDSSRQNTLKRGTLPFANENVGTIKQRQQSSSKPSIVTATDVTTSQDGVSDVTTRQVELKAGVFEAQSETDTMKRNRKTREGQTAENNTASSQQKSGKLPANERSKS